MTSQGLDYVNDLNGEMVDDLSKEGGSDNDNDVINVLTSVILFSIRNNLRKLLL